MTTNKFVWLLIGFFISIPLLQFTSCERIDDFNANLSNALGILDEGINMMNNQSSSWRETLEYVYDNMPETMHDVKEDIGVLMNESIGAVTGSILCVADAVPTRVLNQLIRMRAKLEEGYVPRICPTICQTSINEIDLSESDEIYETIAFYGYDFPTIDRLFVVLKKNNGEAIGITEVIAASTSGYGITVGLKGRESVLAQYDRLALMCDNTVISELLIFPN